MNHMSGGEKQSLVFASTEVAGPQLYILDEPTANLDHIATLKMREQIEVALDEGKTVIVAEHRLDFIADLVTRALLIDNGQIVRSMTSEELLSLDSAELEKLGLRNPKHKRIESITAKCKANEGQESNDVARLRRVLRWSARERTCSNRYRSIFLPAQCSESSGRTVRERLRCFERWRVWNAMRGVP